jgi:hypothetical protein
MSKFKRIVVGKTTIDVSGIEFEVTIIRNENGNLEVIGYQEYFENGTCTQGYNEEVEFYGHDMHHKWDNILKKYVDVDEEVVLSEIRAKLKADKLG